MNTSPPPKPRLWLTFALAALALFGLPCLGLAGGFGFTYLRGQGTFSAWETLGSPPEPAVEIVTGGSNSVTLRSHSGKTYACTHGVDNENCWFETEETPSPDPNADYERHYYQGEVPPPPGKTIDSFFVTYWLAEQAYETRYALLSDGSVWVWNYGSGSYTVLGDLLIGLGIGLALGILTALALVILGVARARRASRQVS